LRPPSKAVARPWRNHLKTRLKSPPIAKSGHHEAALTATAQGVKIQKNENSVLRAFLRL
jgi:hypothetical protein